MMFGLMRVRTHDAEMAKKDRQLVDWRAAANLVRADLKRQDKALLRAWEQLEERNLALQCVTAERDTLQARLDALTPARGQGGRFAKREAV